MRSRYEGYATVVVGVLIGLFVASIPLGFTTRNSSGTYSLPAGNPVVSGTTITTTWANNTLNDLKTEMTDSLSRSGNGAMLAQLEGYAGTSSLPGYSFDGDADTGLYRNASNDVRMGVDATYVQKWTSTGVTFPLATTQTGALTCAAGVTVTNSGAGAGLTVTGGSSDGAGLVATGGASNGIGGVFDGAGSGVALDIGTGNAKFTGSTPTSSTAFTNTITTKNFVKMWATITSNGSALSVTSGFNITSVGASGNNFLVTFASAMADTDYGMFISANSNASGLVPIALGQTSTTTATFACRDGAGGAINCNTTGSGTKFFVQIIGAQ